MVIRYILALFLLSLVCIPQLLRNATNLLLSRMADLEIHSGMW